MNRFKTIPTSFTPNVVVEVSAVVKFDLGKRITDDSHYVPNKEANKILAKQQAGQLLNDLMYDNPQDLKNGSVNVYARQKGRDLAELTQQARELVSDISDLSAKAEHDLKAKLAKSQLPVQSPVQSPVQPPVQPPV